MAVKRRDKEFHLRKITYVDYHSIEMDRVLTMLFPRLKYNGYASRHSGHRRSDVAIRDIVFDFLKHDEEIINALEVIIDNNAMRESFIRNRSVDSDWFDLSSEAIDKLQELAEDVILRNEDYSKWFQGLTGNSSANDIMPKWIETDLMDIINRGKPNQAIAAPRPLHGNTYKFRNPRYSRDYGASEHVYWMLYHARGGKGQAALDALKSFFFEGIDIITDEYDPEITVDVETQALLHLDQQVRGDREDSNEPDRFPPLCSGHADLLADDILRLLAYKGKIPRSVLVEYLKILLAFHLGLYHLKLFKILPRMVETQAIDSSCTLNNCVRLDQRDHSQIECSLYKSGVLVDLSNLANERMTELSMRCAETHFRRIPNYVYSQFVIKKLDELAEYLGHKVRRIAIPSRGYFALDDLLGLLHSQHANERDPYFRARLVNVIEDLSVDGEVPPEVRKILDLHLSDFDTFVEIMVFVGSKHRRGQIMWCLDSFFLKNSDGGLLRQASASKSRRYFALGSKLLEVLLQIAVLKPEGTSFSTRQMRIDELITFLRLRYGIYIDRLPEEEGFGKPSIIDQKALRLNVESFKSRLREIGFYEDLSDAYYTQMVTSRYTI